MQSVDEKLRAAVQMILRLFAEQNYSALANLTTGEKKRLRASEIAHAIQSYPATIRMPTETELTFDSVEVAGSDPRQYLVDAPLFTIEEGRSDLTARMTVIDRPGDDFEVVFYDAWVM
jgi:hypothetical protein